MRLFCAAGLLVVAACSPFVGAPHATGQPGASGAGSGASPVVVATPPSSVAVVLQAGPGAMYGVSLITAAGQVAGAARAHLRSPLAPGQPAALPMVSASNSRVYYLDGDATVRFLGLDGSQGVAATLPSSPGTEATFAISPDDRRIAIATTGVTAGASALSIVVEDIGGSPRGPALSADAWPVGWHGDGLVLALGAARARSVAANPYGTFAGYEVMDPASGARLSGIECEPAGPLTAAGTACVGGPLTTADLAGHQAPLAWTAPIESAAEAPDGARVAVCCPAGQVEVVDVAGGAVSELGAGPPQGYGWVDAVHLFVPGMTGQPAHVVDVRSGAAAPAAASGRVVARIPGAL